MLKEEMYENHTYRHWLNFFYYYALNGFSIKGALNEASKKVGLNAGWKDEENTLYNETWYKWIDESTHLGRMRIYGNGRIHLPT